MDDPREPATLSATKLPVAEARRARLPLRLRQALAWGVHLYTATGLIAAALMALAILRGDAASFRVAFLLMVAATLIDATDGALARLVRVKEVLPGFDGRRLDDLVDFQTYVTLPLLLIWQARLLPPGQEGWLLLPLLASAYGFCQAQAKTGDGYFLGFPSYWNIVAFYLYIFQPPPGVVAGLLAGFALLTFVPFRYLYATQPGRLNRLTNYLGALWCVALVATISVMPGDPAAGETADGRTRALAWLSMLFPAYYLLVSWSITARLWYRHSQRRRDRKRVRTAL